MKELLQAIQTQLRADGNLSYINDDDIFITPDENMIPVTANFPAVGLKDGPIQRIVETAETWEPHYAVYVIVYQLMSPGETAIVGGTNPTIHGVLDIAKDIHASLNDNKLGITGMELAYPGDERQSETIDNEELCLQKKKLSYIYQKEEERP